MTKAVLISINPKWCELIASGKKTVEVRKSRPKLETPFKCYIYQTQRGGVIGEFVCWCISGCRFARDDNLWFSNDENIESYEEVKNSCLSAKEIIDYGQGKGLWFWHISDLVIYDKPKALCEFDIEYPPQSWRYVKEMTE